jgi:retinol dehydrogenase 12
MTTPEQTTQTGQQPAASQPAATQTSPDRRAGTDTPTQDLAGQIMLVSGATGGIGRAAAARLAQRGAQVTIIGRDPERTARVAGEIGAAGFLVGDLSQLGEVRRVAAEFAAGHDRLDVLLNNAGAFYNKRQETAEGLEMTWALNHLNYFLLTQELLPLLRAAGQARIVSVSSAAHVGARMRWDDLEFRRGYSGWAAYGQSKLANILFTRELAHRLQGSGVTANALHPGMVATGFGHNNSPLLSRVFSIIRPLSKTDEQGALTSIYLAGSPEVQGVTGRYFSNERESQPTAQALDDAAALRLWQLSEEYVRV